MPAWDSAPDTNIVAARRLLRTTFSPNSPIRAQEVFAGRQRELELIADAITQTGQHAVIYGDRGVGKTSLALVAQEIATSEGYFTAFVTCDSSLTFTKIWRQVFRDIGVDHPDGYSDASYLLDGDVLPDDVRIAFRALSLGAPAVVFVDEFDTVTGSEDRKLFANLIKILSDQAIPVTIVFVGVARDVNQLIEDHASVQRALAEISMPRMSMDEMADIVRTGVERAGMKADHGAVRRISTLSQGMPTIVHRLGQQAALKALDRDSWTVEITDTEAAITPVVSQNMETISTVYNDAVFSSQKDTLYKAVALACACAKTDDKGFFTSGALREPLKAITGKAYEIPAYAAHLNAFTTTRGPLLEKIGRGKRFQYRFLNPLYPAYITLKALQDDMITYDELNKLTGA